MSGLAAPLLHPLKWSGWLLGRRDDGSSGFFHCDHEWGKLELLKEHPDYVSSTTMSLTTGPAGDFLVFFTRNQKEPGDLWSLRPDTAKVERITHLKPKFVQIELGDAKLVHWTTNVSRPPCCWPGLQLLRAFTK